MPIRVIKLGGSLLTLPDWHERFLRWLATEPPATNLLLVGGGELVDVLRREHERFPYTERQMHFATLATMEINAELALARFPNAVFVENFSTLQRLLPPVIDQGLIADSSLSIVRISSWWQAAVAAGHILPDESWHVTSDTLAAWIARQLAADELVLLKSSTPPLIKQGSTLAETWAAQNYVDPHFPKWVATVASYRAVNLRASEYDSHS